MAKKIAQSVQDASLDKIGTGTIMTVCSAEPTTRTEAVTTFALADVALAGGDFTKAAGGAAGSRKTTVAAKNGVAVDTSGTATHIAICDATEVLGVTTCTSQALTAGNQVNIPAHAYQVNQPT